jgi:hypothetical protein
MLRFLIFICLIGLSCPSFSQITRSVLVNSDPEGALVTNISGRDDFIGNTPLNHKFDFHSEVSVMRIRLSACGYYDTVIKINPKTENLLIKLDKKKFLILPDTKKDILPENDRKLLASFMVGFLNEFSIRNLSKPVNFMDFAVVRRKDDNVIVNMIFELDPEALPSIQASAADSVLKDKWEEWFEGSLRKSGPAVKSKIDGYDFYFSVISGKKNLSIRHLPGVDVRNEFKSEVSVYENDYERVITTTYYYETEVDPTFNTRLDYSQRYYELLYKLSKNQGNNQFYPAQEAVLRYSKGSVNKIFSSSAELQDYSMLTRFLNRK